MNGEFIGGADFLDARFPMVSAVFPTFAVTSSLATLVARTWSKTLACSGNPSHADHVA